MSLWTRPETDSTCRIEVMGCDAEGISLRVGKAPHRLTWGQLDLCAEQSDRETAQLYRELRAAMAAHRSWAMAEARAGEQRAREDAHSLATMSPVGRRGGWVALGSPGDGRPWGSRCSTLVRLHGRLVVTQYETVEQACLDWMVWDTEEACARAIEALRARQEEVAS